MRFEGRPAFSADIVALASAGVSFGLGCALRLRKIPAFAGTTIFVSCFDTDTCFSWGA
jgi:hypothetical protein